MILYILTSLYIGFVLGAICALPKKQKPKDVELVPGERYTTEDPFQNNIVEVIDVKSGYVRYRWISHDGGTSSLCKSSFVTCYPIKINS
jgi:hypothetical protein